MHCTANRGTVEWRRMDGEGGEGSNCAAGGGVPEGRTKDPKGSNKWVERAGG
jgi:hypothetical protein